MIDLVTVVFQDELPVLKLQAQSVNLYCQNIGIRSIFVMVNDTQQVADQIDPAWWGSLSHCVRVMPRDIFSLEYWSPSGWVSQQILKLLGSSISHNRFSMVLDAKTIFVGPVDANKIVNYDDTLQIGYHPIRPTWHKIKNVVNELFDIDLQHIAMPGGVPFVFHNNTVREMLVEITRLTNKNAVEWLQYQDTLSEFVVYTGYILYRDGTLDRVYQGSQRIRCANLCHSEAADSEKKLNNMHDPDLLTVSIHRNAWSQLTKEQQQSYVDLLRLRGITSAQDLA
jgi:Family of unknown function (DUF6492)